MYLAGASTLEEISIGLMDKSIYNNLNAYNSTLSGNVSSTISIIKYAGSKLPMCQIINEHTFHAILENKGDNCLTCLFECNVSSPFHLYSRVCSSPLILHEI